MPKGDLWERFAVLHPGVLGRNQEEANLVQLKKLLVLSLNCQIAGCQ